MAVLKIIHKVHAKRPQNVPEKKYHDGDALSDVISYCLRPDKTPSHCIGGLAVKPEYAVEQMELLAQAHRKASGIRLRHMVLSFEENERISAQRAGALAFQIASYYGDEYQIIYAVHEDKDTKDIHFVMNTVSYRDGHKYTGHRDDYYRFQKYVRTLLWDEFKFQLIVVPDRIEEPQYRKIPVLQ